MGEIVCLIKGHDYYQFDGTTLTPLMAVPDGERLCGFFLHPDQFISHSLTLPLTTDEEGFYGAVELQMYESGSLDSTLPHRIAYTRSRIDTQDAWSVLAFAADTPSLHAIFDAQAQRLGHIDFIGIPYLVYSVLYARDWRPAEGVDLYLYLGSDVSFATLYHDGDLLTYRQLPSLDAMATQMHVTTEQLKKILHQRGIDRTRYADKEQGFYLRLTEMMEDFLGRIRSTVHFAAALLGSQTVQHILLDFEQREIPGLWTLLDTYGFDTSAKESLTLSSHQVEGIHQHLFLEAAYLQAALDGSIAHPVNLTLWRRPPRVGESLIGRMGIGVGLALLLLLGYQGYKSYRLHRADTHLQALRHRYQTLSTDGKQLIETVARLTQEKKRLKHKERLEEQQTHAWGSSVQKMVTIRTSALRRRAMMRSILSALEHYHLKASALHQVQDTRFTIRILSDYDARETIAQFMQQLKSHGYTQVHTQLISRQNEQYESEVEVIQ